MKSRLTVADDYRVYKVTASNPFKYSHMIAAARVILRARTCPVHSSPGGLQAPHINCRLKLIAICKIYSRNSPMVELSINVESNLCCSAHILRGNDRIWSSLQRWTRIIFNLIINRELIFALWTIMAARPNLTKIVSWVCSSQRFFWLFLRFIYASYLDFRAFMWFELPFLASFVCTWVQSSKGGQEPSPFRIFFLLHFAFENIHFNNVYRFSWPDIDCCNSPKIFFDCSFSLFFGKFWLTSGPVLSFQNVFRFIISVFMHYSCLALEFRTLCQVFQLNYSLVCESCQPPWTYSFRLKQSSFGVEICSIYSCD